MRAGEPVSSDGNSIAAGVAARPRRVFVVEPMDAKEIQRIGRIRVDGAEALRDRRRDGRGVLQLAEGRQDDPGVAEASERSPVNVAIDQMGFQSEPRHSAFPSHSRQMAGQGTGQATGAPQQRPAAERDDDIDLAPCRILSRAATQTTASPERRTLASVACTGRPRSWSDRTPVSSKLIRRVKSTRSHSVRADHARRRRGHWSPEAVPPPFEPRWRPLSGR